jgi:hypothetical protein
MTRTWNHVFWERLPIVCVPFIQLERGHTSAHLEATDDGLQFGLLNVKSGWWLELGALRQNVNISHHLQQAQTSYFLTTIIWNIQNVIILRANFRTWPGPTAGTAKNDKIRSENSLWMTEWFDDNVRFVLYLSFSVSTICVSNQNLCKFYPYLWLGILINKLIIIILWKNGKHPPGFIMKGSEINGNIRQCKSFIVFQARCQSRSIDVQTITSNCGVTDQWFNTKARDLLYLV